MLQKGIYDKQNIKEKMDFFFKYRIYLTTFSRYFVYDSIKLIFLSIVSQVSDVANGPLVLHNKGLRSLYLAYNFTADSHILVEN